MSKIKTIVKILEYFTNNYKDEYSIACSLVPYIDTSKRIALEKEIIKRINMFNADNRLIIKKEEIIEILEDLKTNLGLKYGTNDEILYGSKLSLNYKFISDFCKGASMINSIYSNEYTDMDSKDYKRRLSILLIKINNNLEESYNNLNVIVNKEVSYITQQKKNKTQEGKKLSNYHAMIKNNRKEYDDEVKIIEEEIKTANKVNKIIGDSIGLYILLKHTIYDIITQDYDVLIRSVKDQFDYKSNDNAINIYEYTFNVCMGISDLYKVGEKDWDTDENGIICGPKDIIDSISKAKIILNKGLKKEILIDEMREINNYLINTMNSVEVKKIVENNYQEIVNNNQKKESAEMNNIIVEKESLLKRGINWFYK